MKRAGYPEDSTQSAYSSQLIRIPLSLPSVFIFAALFLERKLQDNVGAVIRISYWGSGRGLGWRLQTCTYALLPSTVENGERRCLHQIWWVPHRQHSSFCWCKLSALSLNVSFRFCLGRLLCASDVASERVYCLARLTNQLCLNCLLARLTHSIAIQMQEEKNQNITRGLGMRKINYWNFTLIWTLILCVHL